MRTGDLVVGINGMDARFMSHHEAVAAIRFGAEGYDQAIRAQAALATSQNGTEEEEEEEKSEDITPPVSFPLEVDTVQLTLIRPLPPAPQPISRAPSTYLVTPQTPVPSATAPKVCSQVKALFIKS